MTTEPTGSNTPPMPERAFYFSPVANAMLWPEYSEALESWGTAGWALVQEWEASAEQTNDALRFEHSLMLTWKDKATELGTKLEEAENQAKGWSNAFANLSEINELRHLQAAAFADQAKDLQAKLEEAERDYQNEMKETDALKLRLVAASETDAKYRAQAAALAEALDELYAAVCCQRYAPTEDEWPLGVKVCALLTTYREGR